MPDLVAYIFIIPDLSSVKELQDCLLQKLMGVVDSVNAGCLGISIAVLQNQQLVLKQLNQEDCGLIFFPDLALYHQHRYSLSCKVNYFRVLEKEKNLQSAKI